MRTGPKMAKAKQVGPGRCDHCGCLMVMVGLHDRMIDSDPLRRVGWRCLVCGRTVDLHSMVRRQERPSYEDPYCRSYRQDMQVQHG